MGVPLFWFCRGARNDSRVSSILGYQVSTLLLSRIPRPDIWKIKSHLSRTLKVFLDTETLSIARRLCREVSSVSEWEIRAVLGTMQREHCRGTWEVPYCVADGRGYLRMVLSSWVKSNEHRSYISVTSSPMRRQMAGAELTSSHRQSQRSDQGWLTLGHCMC